MNRIDRLTGTLLMLQSQRRLSVAAIASHWEISERTVYRDIAALCEAGVPIVFEPETGYRLMGGYEVPPVMFSEEEALALFLSGEIAEQFADASLRDSIRTALLKIRSVLPEERQSLLENFKKSLGIWINSAKPDIGTECLIPIHNAVLQKKCIHVSYDTAQRGFISERVVEPLGILYYGNHWHLIAYCRFREDYRDFRMDRVRKWEALDEGFTAHDQFSLDEFISHREVVENMIPITVVVKSQLAERFQRRLLAEPSNVELFPDGSTRLTFQSISLEWSAHWLLSYGPGVRVEAPLELREQMKRMAEQVVEHYS